LSFDLFKFSVIGVSEFKLPVNTTEAVFMKKVCFVLFAVTLFPLSGFSMGKPPQGVSLLLVPSTPAMVQLGLDMAAQDHAVLMTYAENTDPGSAYIHIWDGNRWLRIPPEAYKSGSFLRNSPVKLLVVGEESGLTALLIEQGLGWCPEVLHLGTLHATDLINQMGRLYEFDRREWEWIAKRYQLDLEAMNSQRQQESWYDSHRASTLPPPDRPWQRQDRTQHQAPQTSLPPMMPPLESLEKSKELDKPSASTDPDVEAGTEVEDAADTDIGDPLELE
jgi:hypothetical protein